MASQHDPSLERRRLGLLLAELSDIRDAFCEREPLVEGRFELLRRSCGKSPCRCERGELHETKIFLDRTSGRRRTYKDSSAMRRGLQGPVDNCSRLRRLRVRLRKLQAEFLQTCDRLKDWRIREGVRLVARITER